jgi:hypothetical protein
MAGPYNFLTQWKEARNLLLSANSQSAWQGALTLSALTQRQRFDGGAVLGFSSTRRSDQGYSGKGTAFATNGQVTSWDTKFQGFKAELSPWLAGYLFAFLMGTDTVTGSASPYTHTFNFDETTRIAVPTTIYVEDTAAIKYLCPDMCIDEVTLTVNEIGAIVAEMSMLGTGYQTIGALSPLPALASESYILGSDAALTFGSGAGASMIGRHMKTTFKAQNQLQVHRAPGGGLYGLFVRKQNPKFSIATTIAAKDTDDIYTLFQNDTASVYSLVVNSGAAAQLTISIPVAHLKTTKLGFDGDMEIWELEFDETSAFDVSGVSPVTVTVVNSVASYLTGVA